MRGVPKFGVQVECPARRGIGAGLKGDASFWGRTARPGCAASVGFHLRHIAGSTDRLLTYARGQRLSETQRQALALEKGPGDPPADAATLVRGAQTAIQDALEVIRVVPRETLFAPRTVGRGALPTNVFGLLSHLAQHTQRHTGQLITTAKIIRGLGLR